VYYEAPGGGRVIERAIVKARLGRVEVAAFETTLARIEAGTSLPNDVKHVRGDIYEARVTGHKRIFRLLYAECAGEPPILLGLVFFAKTTRATPDNVIALAEQRLTTYREHN
jgi:phage-related protein